MPLASASILTCVKRPGKRKRRQCTVQSRGRVRSPLVPDNKEKARSNSSVSLCNKEMCVFIADQLSSPR